jgi:hypothetical protein
MTGVTVVELTDWSGLVCGRTDSFNSLTVIKPMVPAASFWSGPFRVTASDQRDYWVKSLETCPPGHGPSLAIEQIVSRVGRLIGAPVCETSLIRIPADLDGWQPYLGVPIRAGLAHASLSIERAMFGRRTLEQRDANDNQRRHVGVYALYDWCIGADEQWLYDLADDHAVWSHDHGLYLPPAGSGFWNRHDLVVKADEDHSWRDPPVGLSAAAANDVADALEKIDRPTLAGVLCSIPAAWPVSDEDLEAVGWFLEHRAPAVASRLRALVRGSE